VSLDVGDRRPKSLCRQCRPRFVEAVNVKAADITIVPYYCTLRVPLKNASTNAQKSDLEKEGERNAAAIAWLKEEVDPSVLDPKHRWQAK
jgi:hypothetical protein